MLTEWLSLQPAGCLWKEELFVVRSQIFFFLAGEEGILLHTVHTDPHCKPCGISVSNSKGIKYKVEFVFTASFPHVECLIFLLEVNVNHFCGRHYEVCVGHRVVHKASLYSVFGCHSN